MESVYRQRVGRIARLVGTALLQTIKSPLRIAGRLLHAQQHRQFDDIALNGRHRRFQLHRHIDRFQVDGKSFGDVAGRRQKSFVRL